MEERSILDWQKNTCKNEQWSQFFSLKAGKRKGLTSSLERKMRAIRKFKGAAFVATVIV